ncbi:MAG: YlxR family protein [bacterium]|nr:YlxR family protein [bacterium]
MNNKTNNIVNNYEEDAKKASSSIMRKCCACGKIADRKDFIRILRNHKTGEYIISPDNKQFGRSIYICKCNECLKSAIKKKRLKALSEEQIEQIKAKIL